MYALHALVRVTPETRAAFVEAASACVAQTRDEPGCLDYSCTEDISEPGLFHFVELWQDVDAFNSHTASPHYTAFAATLADETRIRRAGRGGATFIEGRVLSAEDRAELGFGGKPAKRP
ncbi:putative quinol monooxygenase [Streptomyces flaveolus]|uniref:putative quinol monooxygenase n=1 Tax=Streptomyces flaveolus TaxID=67297 RepID=UPI00380D5F6C